MKEEKNIHTEPDRQYYVSGPAPGYDPELKKSDPDARYMEQIHEMAVSG